MHKLTKAALAVCAGGAASLAAGLPALAAAGGSVARYQVTTYSITATVETVYGHVYTATDNPCTTGIGVFSGTGYGTDSNEGITETITGTLNGSTLTYEAVYASGYYYDVTATVQPDGSFSGTGSNATQSFSVAGTIAESSTSYANHGQYVSSLGGGSGAAHSCIGMPIRG